MSGRKAEALVGYAVDALIEAGLISRDHLKTLDRAELLRSLAEAQLDVLTRAHERDRGVIVPSEPRSPLLTQADPEPIAPTSQERGNGTTLSDILEAFHQERTSGTRTLAQKTMDEHKSAVRMLGEFLGGTVPARSITRKDMLTYKAALLQTPSRYTLRFPGLDAATGDQGESKALEAVRDARPEDYQHEVAQSYLDHLQMGDEQRPP